MAPPALTAARPRKAAIAAAVAAIQSRAARKHLHRPAVRVRMQLDETCSVAEVLAAVAAERLESVLRNGGRDTFVEVRHLPTMSRPETFSWLAMILGWMENGPVTPAPSPPTSAATADQLPKNSGPKALADVVLREAEGRLSAKLEGTVHCVR